MNSFCQLLMGVCSSQAAESCVLRDAGRQMEWKSSPIKPGLSSEEEANSSERWPLAPWQKVLTQILV
ncbi:hypothetical protein NQZ68_032964 [Dissostichus eleginoides]|nr:hypothetical protein NQZ68_032964 [Dissostichus eleginoides]